MRFKVSVMDDDGSVEAISGAVHIHDTESENVDLTLTAIDAAALSGALEVAADAIEQREYDRREARPTRIAAAS